MQGPHEEWTASHEVRSEKRRSTSLDALSIAELDDNLTWEVTGVEVLEHKLCQVMFY